MTILWLYLAGAFTWGVVISIGSILYGDFIYHMGEEGAMVPMLKRHTTIYAKDKTHPYERKDTYKTVGSGALLNTMLWPITLPWFFAMCFITALSELWAVGLDYLRNKRNKDGSPESDGDGNSPSAS